MPEVFGASSWTGAHTGFESAKRVNESLEDRRVLKEIQDMGDDTDDLLMMVTELESKAKLHPSDLENLRKLNMMTRRIYTLIREKSEAERTKDGPAPQTAEGDTLH
jgi:hypothetical protein